MNKSLQLGLTAVGAAGIVIGYQELTQQQTIVESQPDHIIEAPVHQGVAQGQNVLTSNSHQAFGAMVDLSPAAESSVHGVVHVTNKSLIEHKSYSYNPFQHFFYGTPYQEQKHVREAVSSGSGVIISEDGYIVTNNHVVKNASELIVALNDETSYTATLVGSDPNTDLALLKIEAEGLSYIPWGNPEDVKIGQWVLAVGNPFNLNSTVTAGIVSAKGRDINILRGDQKSGVAPIESFIQTDAAVNPGNSGGALVNASGELVGINTAIKSNTGSYTGYSFAVPVSIVKKVVADLVEFGQVQRAFLGVRVSEVDPKLVEEKDLKETRGIYVADLTESGAAKEAGIKPGDVITQIGSTEVHDMALFQEEMSKFRPGDEVYVKVNRNGKILGINMELRNQYGNTATVEQNASAMNVNNVLGASLEDISDQEKKALGVANGVKVNKLFAGKLRKAGLKEGFVITKIDHQPVSSQQDIANLLKNKKGGVLIEGKFPSGNRGYFAVPI